MAKRFCDHYFLKAKSRWCASDNDKWRISQPKRIRSSRTDSLWDSIWAAKQQTSSWVSNSFLLVAQLNENQPNVHGPPPTADRRRSRRRRLRGFQSSHEGSIKEKIEARGIIIWLIFSFFRIFRSLLTKKAFSAWHLEKIQQRTSFTSLEVTELRGRLIQNPGKVKLIWWRHRRICSYWNFSEKTTRN